MNESFADTVRVGEPQGWPGQDPEQSSTDPWLGISLGKYLITGRLGEGGIGAVYEAEDKFLKRKVAIKLLKRPLAADPKSLQRFLREARSAACLNHPNVIVIHEIDQHQGVNFIVMELVQGRSAAELLKSGGPLPWPRATAVAADACRGLAAAHAAGVMHRDIKPGNLLLTHDGVAKLADFGVAKSTDPSRPGLTGFGKLVGTVHYLSPEQCRREPLDERSDLYSLGATYYTLLIGKPPYQGNRRVDVMFRHCSAPIPNPCKENPGIPEVCAAVLRRAMAKNRTERFQNADEMLADLEAILAPPTAIVAPPTPVEPLGELADFGFARWLGRVVLLGCVLLALLVGGTIMMADRLLSSRKSDPRDVAHATGEDVSVQGAFSQAASVGTKVDTPARAPQTNTAAGNQAPQVPKKQVEPPARQADPDNPQPPPQDIADLAAATAPLTKRIEAARAQANKLKNAVELPKRKAAEKALDYLEEANEVLQEALAKASKAQKFLDAGQQRAAVEAVEDYLKKIEEAKETLGKAEGKLQEAARR